MTPFFVTLSLTVAVVLWVCQPFGKESLGVRNVIEVLFVGESLAGAEADNDGVSL